MCTLFIKGALLNKHFKSSSDSSYYLYQFQIQNNDGLYSIINIHSKKNMNLEINELVELPITVTLYNNQIIYEFKKA